jgi:hypothetical protein
VKVTAAELDVTIRAWLGAGHSGDIVLHVIGGRIKSCDFKEHWEVSSGDLPHTYTTAFVAQK